MSKVKLPEWARQGGVHGELPVIDVDADAAYTAWLKELGVAKPTRYWLEVAYQCIKLDLQIAMRGFTFEIHIHDDGKKWAQRQFPKGRGALAATQGYEAREHFRRLRGFLP
jgi:hypothetical protein